MPNQSSLDEAREQALTDNTAQGVLKNLKELYANRARTNTRWIWELLQNARDTSANIDETLVVTIEHKKRELTFQHNGPRFTAPDIAHLIYHGSSKFENKETIGQYGSGFLTTHLLSSKIFVSGQIEGGHSFEFCLDRAIGSVEELKESMSTAWKYFKNGLSEKPSDDTLPTRFRYPIADDAVDVVKHGLAMLRQCAAFAVVFNKEFSCIDIKTCDYTVSFEVIERIPLEAQLQQIIVSENYNGHKEDRRYLLATGQKSFVAVPLKSTDSSQICLPINDIPRLFLGFPLIGTERFSFPAVINSVRFTPTEDRDGVYIGQNDNDKANIENQQALEEACKLLIAIIEFAASSGWQNAYTLANTLPIPSSRWLKSERLRDILTDKFIDKLRDISIIINKNGDVMSPRQSKLPFAIVRSYGSAHVV